MKYFNLNRPSILVVGDIMLDIQIYGTIEKLANEAPIPVLHHTHEKKGIGGCGNVLMNLQSLGCSKLFLVSMIGNDSNGDIICNILKSMTNVTYNLSRNNLYTTTTKVRGFAEKKIIFRYDIEKKTSICDTDIEASKTAIKHIIDTYALDGIILSDYNKGFMTPEITQYIIELANSKEIPTFVDPKVDYQKYKGCTLFKPNIKEIKDIFNIQYSDDAIEDIHKKIQENVQCKETLITLSEKGMTYLKKSESLIYQKTKTTEVYDVTGAGDIVLSIVAYFYKLYAPETILKLAAWLGTHSVKFTGTYIVQQIDLFNAFKSIQNTKLLTVDNILQIPGKKVVTNGCFDILHEGHLKLFRHCKSLCSDGGFVIVALNSDSSIKKLKGDERPINTLATRVEMLNAIDYVDWIIVFDEETPHDLYEKIRPTILVKGGDYNVENIIGREFCEKIVLVPYKGGYSTTNIIKKICMNAPIST